ncbi:terminase gpA endonuclease subunit [Bremerella sp.]|uniref:terminase gpA endonuclease subunit n=1 Tax=Bremerella sp. TaxID=2795602 RepID=UPI00391CF4B9
MATDPRKLRPSELCRLLNSTPLGEVTSERQIYHHRQRAGHRIGDGRTVDLLRYCAWMHQTRHAPKTEPEDDRYERMKEAARARNAALALAGRDIGELPAVENPDRKDRASRDFRYFCESYFPLTFHLDWSDDHLKVIDKIERAVVEGGLFALAMARGSGKSSIAEVACIWAVLYGHREFVCLIGSDEGHACDMLDSIKSELDSNDQLLADFPEVCFPIQALDGIANRANGQLYQGKRTQIGWTAKEIVLPTIEGSRASGAIIKVAGLTGRIRGMKFKRPDGRTVRPSLVVLDDPQTDESARSLSQCANRESILAGAVLGLSGPGKKISGIMPCTVIRPGDMADNILDRDKHPEWNGERTRMVYSFPKNESLWQRYAEIRSEGLRNGDGGAAATEFYREHREEMDEGAEVAWPQRYNHDELSAIQHAMNLKLQDEAAFFAEYQNKPLIEESVGEGMLTADEIAGKFNRMERGSVPIGCNHLTAFIDVQQKMLFYLVAAWEDDFTGYIVDYGSYPDQRRPYFTLRDARQTLVAAAQGTGLEGSIYAGLESLTEILLGREWQRDDGAAIKIGQCLIDANWGHSTDVVYQFCRQSSHAALLMPSHGRFVGASTMPFSEYKRRPGDRVGLNWRIPNTHGKRAIRHVLYDTNWWKSFVHARLSVAMGDRGCLSLFGTAAETHRLLAEHLTAEYFVKTEGRGRTVDEWKIRPEQPDNHWLDCLVGAAVAASMQGAVLFGTDGAVSRKPSRVSFKELQRRKKQ